MTCLTDELVAAWAARELHANELALVEGHAAECAECRGLVIAMFGVVPGEPAALGAVGGTIGRYQVSGSIGEGAMGVVVRGRDPVLGRDVAIKMINAHTVTAEQRERMLEEARALGQIEHPNVVRVYDAGLVGDEVFVAMECVTGPTLTRWLDEGPRALAEVVHVLAGVGSGLAAIHGRGLVHRDIKPDNILIDDGRGVIVDLGLARAITARGSPELAGTPRFLSPEVLSGRSATAASDQFAWWTVVDEAIGRLDGSPRRRRAIAKVIGRGRAAEPANRFSTMAEAVGALESAARPAGRWWFAVAVPVTAALVTIWLARSGPSDGCEPRTGEWSPARHAMLAIQLVTSGVDAPAVLERLDARAARSAELEVLSCHVAAGDGGEAQMRALAQQLCATVTWRETARLVERLAAGSSDPRALLDELADVLPVERCSDGPVPSIPRAAPPALEPAIATLHGERAAIARDPSLHGPARVARLRDLLSRVEALGHGPLIETVHADLAEASWNAGDFAGARRELEAGLRTAETTGDDQRRVANLINLLRLAVTAGDTDVVDTERAAEAAAARLGNDSLTGQVRETRGTLALGRGDPETGARLVREAIALLEPTPYETQALVMAVHSLGLMQQGLGDWRGAAVTLDRAYALARRRYGEHRIDTVTIRGARAANLIALDARAARDELAIVERQLVELEGEAHFDVANARSFLCTADLELHAATAVSSCALALAAFERALPDHPRHAATLGMLGHAELLAGQYDAAIEHLSRAVHTVDDASQRLASEAYLALALHRANHEPARARELARHALREGGWEGELAAELAVTFRIERPR